MPSTSIEKLLEVADHDLDAIWSWNHELPPTYDFCMHEMVSQRAEEFPSKVAIASWDGDLTYSQVDRYSTTVAQSLRQMGVQAHNVVPVCFEKSRWCVVAMLGVMKAGATFAMMDPSLPLARLQNMAIQVGAKSIVSSRQQENFASSILPDGDILVVDESTAQSSSSAEFLALPRVPASTLMYIIFTSGSTGTPKGVQISHQTYTSSAVPRAKAVGYTEESRVLDFASYAFDVSIDSMLLTLGNGGCLCIPSDEDRMNDINAAIRRMKINYAGLTPSVARILDADNISAMSALGLGGEAVSARDVMLWGQSTRIVIGYGPCECTIGCTVNSSAATGRNYISIGPGNGAAMWIVDPSDHDRLMPVGAVGELLVEGPIVGQGYLNDPLKTSEGFIEDPTWLLAGHKNYAGRRGRLYKTGDLGKYDPDGSGGILFAGRKDTQVKLRGQRVELGEIESQLIARLPADINIIAEVIVPQAGGQPTLVAFVASRSSKGAGDAELSLAPSDSSLDNELKRANAELANIVPRYMVPIAYIPVNAIPVLISGKTDRKRLRQLGSSLDLRQLDQNTAVSTKRELTDVGQRLQKAWSTALGLETDGIGPDDNFFMLGGSSLAAMKLVSACKVQRLDLTIADVFSHPTLTAMVKTARPCDTQSRKLSKPFSMISRAVRDACDEAANACATENDKIEDIYPCTPTQESLITFSLKSKRPYVAQRVARIPESIILDDWKRAWQEVVSATPILRSRVAQLQEPGLQQIVLRDAIHWKHSSNLDEYLETDRKERMDLGQPLARYAIIENAETGERHMVWTIHHVVYDGWSEPIVLQKVSDALRGLPIQPSTQMKDFVEHVHSIDHEEGQGFWRNDLNGAVGPQFPKLPNRDYLPTPNGYAERDITIKALSGSPFTTATVIRAAWCLLGSQYTRSDDVVFGETFSGRDTPLPAGGVESIIGPLIATVPVRVKVDRPSSVEAYLRSVQEAVFTRMPHQHMGWQNIRKVSQDAQYASEAPTGLVVQPEPEYTGSDLGFEVGDVVREALHFNPYPLMLACGMRKDGFRACASFDTGLLDVAQMERVLARLETTCNRLLEDMSRAVQDIDTLPDAELDQIWRWNETAPLALDTTLGRLRTGANVQQGSVFPRAMDQWVCDSRNHALLSPFGCVGEVCLEGDFLPGETIDSPTWLTNGSSSCAGRRGKVHRTGDLAILNADGSLKFVGRKDTLQPIQCHAVDITELEVHCSKHLPSGANATVSVFRPVGDDSQAQRLVIFVQRPHLDDNAVEIMQENQEIKNNDSSITICASVPVEITIAIKRLNKSFQDSLPVYNTPFAYLVVDKLPSKDQVHDRAALNSLGAKIPFGLLVRLREAYKDLWSRDLGQKSMTPAESVLRSAWANLLGMKPEQIDIDDNFFRLGGDSVLAMKLVTTLRSQGHALSVADIFQNMRLGDAAKVMKLGQGSVDKAVDYKPFMTLGDIYIDGFVSEIVRPKLANPEWPIQDICTTTDSQVLDIKATISAPRTSLQYTMLYFNQPIDRERLLRACNELVKTHDILRTVFIEQDSNFLQVVLGELAIPIEVHRGDNDLEQSVKDICKRDTETGLSLGAPFTKFFQVENNAGQECIVLRLSHAQYDAASLPRMLEDLETLYRGQKLDKAISLPAYVASITTTSAQTKAISYWQNLLKNSTLSVLPGPTGQPTDTAIFKTHPISTSTLSPEITTATLLTAAWAVTLSRRLQSTDVTFGSITSGRNIPLLAASEIIGPCYQFTPVRIIFQPHWTTLDLLHFVQKQAAESSAYDYLGFDNIARKCTSWSEKSTGFFDSIVHHQVAAEDFDTMPFGEGLARVDALKSHGDAALPIKAVSFVKEGRTFVGVVGSERDEGFVERVLGELFDAVGELVGVEGGKLTLE